MTTQTKEHLQGNPNYYDNISWRLLQSCAEECVTLARTDTHHISADQDIRVRNFLGRASRSMDIPSELLILDNSQTRALPYYQRGIALTLNRIAAYAKEKGYTDDDARNTALMYEGGKI